MTSKISSRVSLANGFEIVSILELSIKPSSCFCDMSVLPWSLELEQDLSAAIRFQGLLERFLELVERVHMLHCGRERSISYEVSQLLVNLFDLCALRVAYPIDEPESVEAKTTSAHPFVP